jgi:hypothetical protein
MAQAGEHRLLVFRRKAFSALFRDSIGSSRIFMSTGKVTA